MEQGNSKAVDRWELVKAKLTPDLIKALELDVSGSLSKDSLTTRFIAVRAEGAESPVGKIVELLQDLAGKYTIRGSDKAAYEFKFSDETVLMMPLKFNNEDGLKIDEESKKVFP